MNCINPDDLRFDYAPFEHPIYNSRGFAMAGRMRAVWKSPRGPFYVAWSAPSNLTEYYESNSALRESIAKVLADAYEKHHPLVTRDAVRALVEPFTGQPLDAHDLEIGSKHLSDILHIIEGERICEPCGGTGRSLAMPRDCAKCDGTGKIRDDRLVKLSEVVAQECERTEQIVRMSLAQVEANERAKVLGEVIEALRSYSESCEKFPELKLPSPADYIERRFGADHD